MEVISFLRSASINREKCTRSEIEAANFKAKYPVRNNCSKFK